MQISAAQIRAGRGLLGLTSRQLAARAGVSWTTVKRFEAVTGIPPSRRGTLAKVGAALEHAGVEFLGDPITSPGVRLRNVPSSPSSNSSGPPS